MVPRADVEAVRDLALRLLRPAVEVGPVVRRDLLVQSATASASSNRMGVGLIVLVAVALADAAVGRGLAVWVLLSLANTVASGAATNWLSRHEPDPPERVRSQQQVMSVFFLIGGCSWGSLALLAMPTGPHVGDRAVVTACVLIAMAVNIAFSSATPMLFSVFHGGLMLVAASGFVLVGAFMPATLMVFCLFAAVPLQKQLYLRACGAALLTRRNHLLLEELREERAAVEQMNLRLVEAGVELSHRATRDPLTGLANRALLLELLTSSLERSRPVGRTVGAICVDVDRFASVNDSLGHAVGDELLRQAGVRIAGVLREVDVLARPWGDEFVVLTVDADDGLGAAVVAERIRASFAAPFRVDGRVLTVSSSLGVAADDGVGDGEALLKRAGSALYLAKELGRNRVEVFDPAPGAPVPALRHRVRDEHVAARLFGPGTKVAAHFARMLDLESLAMTGVEVTVGLHEPDAMSLSGAALRDLAARIGMTLQLDEELLRHGGALLTQLGTGRAAGFRVLARIGRTDVELDDLVRFVRADLGGVCSGLSVALAEPQIVSEPRTAAATLQSVRDLGVAVVLDDVGVGASTLRLPAQLPLDGIRLHPDLVRDAATVGGHTERAMLAALAGLARHRGIPLAARGVDTEAQLALLRDAGVTLVQGDMVPVTQLAH